MFWKKKAKPVAEVKKGPALSCMHTGYCSKELCPMWIKFTATTIQEGQIKETIDAKCTLAWTPQLLIELRHHLSLALKKTGETVI